MTVTDPVAGKQKVTRVPLKATTVAEAVAVHKQQEVDRAKKVRNVGRKPKFADYARQYLIDIAAGQGAKAPATVEKVKTVLDR